MGCTFHQAVRSGCLAKRKNPTCYRLDIAAGNVRPYLRNQLLRDFGLELVGARTKGRTCVSYPLEHDRHKVDLDLGTESESQLNNACTRRCSLDIALHIGTSDYVEDHVGATFFANNFHEVFIAIVHRAVSSEIDACLASLSRSIRGDDSNPECLGDLNGGRANAARSPMNEQQLARLEAALHEEIAPDRKECFGKAGCILL